jgi:hypothetical protein
MGLKNLINYQFIYKKKSVIFICLLITSKESEIQLQIKYKTSEMRQLLKISMSLNI